MNTNLKTYLITYNYAWRFGSPNYKKQKNHEFTDQYTVQAETIEKAKVEATEKLLELCDEKEIVVFGELTIEEV